jgi:hypothetical protein
MPKDIKLEIPKKDSGKGEGSRKADKPPSPRVAKEISKVVKPTSPTVNEEIPARSI